MSTISYNFKCGDLVQSIDGNTTWIGIILALQVKMFGRPDDRAQPGNNPVVICTVLSNTGNVGRHVAANLIHYKIDE